MKSTKNRQLLGNEIRVARQRKGYYLRECARKSGVSPTHLGSIENDAQRPVSECILRRLASVLELSSDELLCHAGKVPGDITEYLISNPWVILELRKNMAQMQRLDKSAVCVVDSRPWGRR